MRTRTCYFAKLRPCASVIVCAVAAEGDNVFEGVMVCFTQASSCGADRHPGGNGGRPRYDPG